MAPLEHDNPASKSTQKTSRSSTVQKYTRNYTEAQIELPEEVIDHLVHCFRYIATDNLNKITASQIGNFLPPQYKGKVDYDLVARLLRGQGIVRFTSQQANDILRAHEQAINNSSKSNKQATKHMAVSFAADQLGGVSGRFFNTRPPKSGRPDQRYQWEQAYNGSA
jgi:hypothetical protein